MYMFNHIYFHTLGFSSPASFSCLFLTLIVVLHHDYRESIPKSTKYCWRILVITICGSFQSKLTPLRIADFCWKIPQEAIFSINSRSFSSSQYIVTLVANRENNMTRRLSGFKTKEPKFALHESSSFAEMRQE